MMISEAARVSGVSARVLRHYEDEGLITPDRCHNGYRLYGRDILDRVRVIRFLIESGLPMRLIKEVMPYLTPSTGTNGVCAEFLAEVENYRDRLAERIAGLSAQQAALDGFLGAAQADR
ncbi:MerR family transcriptional regulator [Streptomyces sp. NBC_01304]|uniref:MerR family transcriptional regulator n=1 Tax=Streptomyces sp. NBC_01304 TaxID=2903818 RepID=UPI002E0D9A5B|nr:MerR family transcriptional regulator [Streptomyces sp. NBC_01304]